MDGGEGLGLVGKHVPAPVLDAGGRGKVGGEEGGGARRDHLVCRTPCAESGEVRGCRSVKADREDGEEEKQGRGGQVQGTDFGVVRGPAGVTGREGGDEEGKAEGDGVLLVHEAAHEAREDAALREPEHTVNGRLAVSRQRRRRRGRRGKGWTERKERTMRRVRGREGEGGSGHLFPAPAGEQRDALAHTVVPLLRLAPGHVVYAHPGAGIVDVHEWALVLGLEGIGRLSQYSGSGSEGVGGGGRSVIPNSHWSCSASIRVAASRSHRSKIVVNNVARLSTSGRSWVTIA